MAKRRKTDDVNEVAFRVLKQATEPAPVNAAKRKKNPAAVALGRLGGLKGGKARMNQLTSEQRSEFGSKAAKKRWGKS